MIDAALAALGPIFQGIVGINQQRQAKRGLAGLERPVYDIPDAAKSSLALASSAYGDPRMPGESQMLSRAGQNFSSYLRASRDTGNSTAALAMGQANANRAMEDIGMQSAAAQERDRRDLMSNLDNFAKYQDQKWQMNKFSPYADKYNEFREQLGASQENIHRAIGGLSSVGMQFLAGKQDPVSSNMVADARSSANVAQSQDSFITGAGKMIGKGAAGMYKANSMGLDPGALMNLISNLGKI